MLLSPASFNSCLPVRVEPVKVMTSTSGCSARAWPASWPKPLITFSTPSGSPASFARPARRRAVSGDFSDGLSTMLLPVASAGPSFQQASSSGKFHGTTAAITPTGSRTIIASSLTPVGATSPYTLSMASAYQRMALAAPGISSRRLWRIGFPVSRVSSSASSSRWLSIRSASLLSTALRFAGDACDQSPHSKTRRAA